ncbi:MAG: AraC family transcriptional regulator [Candidatus Hydrogenedentes bacterium]|nr:AraC family transcriptional regulator [Candidatus Hydrogenedentota bacterium]
MHLDSEFSNSITEFELGFLRRKYAHLYDILNKFSSFFDVPLSIYLCEKNGSNYRLLFSVGDLPVCRNTADRPISVLDRSFCVEKLNNLIRVLENKEEAIFLTCRDGYLLWGINVLFTEKYSLLLVMCAFHDSTTEFVDKENTEILKMGALRGYRKVNNRVVKNKEMLLWIRDVLRAVLDKEEAEETGNTGKRLVEESYNGKTDEIPEKKVEEFLENSFDKLRAEVFWIGFIGQNSTLIRKVLTGKGEELWNWSGGKLESIFLLCSWVETLLFYKMLTKRVCQFDKQSIGFLNMREKMNIDKLPHEFRRVVSEISKNILCYSRSLELGLKMKDCERLKTLVNLLTELLWMSPNLSDFEKRMAVRASALSHWLRRKVQVSFEELKSYLQIEECAYYLRNSNMTLSCIGKRVGVVPESHLSIKFKLCTGYSPSEYRELFKRIDLSRRKF